MGVIQIQRVETKLAFALVCRMRWPVGLNAAGVTSHEVVQLALALVAERRLALSAANKELDRRDGALPVVARVALVCISVTERDACRSVGLRR